MTNKHAGSSEQAATNIGALRDRAIAEYHELLAADETLTPATFEKLRSGMRLRGIKRDRVPHVQRPERHADGAKQQS